MDNQIVIDLKKTALLKNNHIKYLNNNNECIICSNNLNNDEELIIINNLCKCYNAVKICQICFFTWISEHNECFICRKKYNTDICNRLNIYHSNNKKIIEKIQELKFNFHVAIISDDISSDISDDIPYNIRLLRYRNKFLSYRTFKLWSYENKYKIFRYICIYSLLIFVLISIKNTIDLNNKIADYNNTHIFIW